MAQKMCMVMMMMVMVFVTVECATINQAIEDYGSCLTNCTIRCGTDEHCNYHCRWICPKPTPQFILKDEAILPKEGGNRPICVNKCRIRCGEDKFCMHNCLGNCPF